MVSCSFFLVYAFSCLRAGLASPLPHASLKPPVSTPLEVETLGFVLLCVDSSSLSTASQSQNQEQVGSVFVLSTLWAVSKLASPGQSAQSLVSWGYYAVLSRSVTTDSLQSRELYPTRLPCPRDSPGENTGVSFHVLLQGIFVTQGLNLGLPHCRWILYQLSRQGSPGILGG